MFKDFVKTVFGKQVSDNRLEKEFEKKILRESRKLFKRERRNILFDVGGNRGINGQRKAS